MDDSQWCLDECPTCATVVYGKSIYCSAKCEPDVEQEPELEHDYVPWSQSSSTRISAWAFDCYKSALTPASSPCIFPSPSQRKLHLRKQYPTSWVTPDTPSQSPSYISSAISTSTAVESLVTSSTAPTSPISRCLPRSWASPSPAPPTRPLLTKTNVYLFSDSTARQPSTPESIETSNRPVTPSELWTSTVVADSETEYSRPKSSMLKQRRWDDPTAYRSRGGP